jgi:serine/threonine protein kinase
MSTAKSDVGELGAEAPLRIIQHLERFERAWEREEPIPLEELLLEEETASRAVLFGQALSIELACRRRRGEAPGTAEYLDRFPEYQGAVMKAFTGEETVPVPAGSTTDASRVDDLAELRAANLAAEPLPETIGKYLVLGRLGEGGQGSAFLARDPDCGRLVVLKRYHTPARDPGADAALQDGKALARLRSRFVPQCYGLERHDDELILVMEYIPGRNLAELIRSRLPAPGVAARWIEQVAEGLEAVHACGLLHRDIKPANLVVGDDGAPRLVDFGVATHLGSPALEGLSGTPPYMAPEQARGQWERIDFRTDVYGLGGVLYALLTGQPPHPGATMSEHLEHAATGDVTPPRTLKPSIPRALERVVLKALAADPARRYASASALRQALWRHRHRLAYRAAVAGLAALVVLVAQALAWPWPWSSRPSRANEITVQAPAPLHGPVQILGMQIEHEGKTGPDTTSPRGKLGEQSFAARLDDDVTVRAELSEPTYSYLIAFRPDGTDEICAPEDESARPARSQHPAYPPELKTTLRYRLSEGSGLHAFALVVSHSPLPPYREWKARIGTPAPWEKALPITPGVVWWHDGRGLASLTFDDPTGLRGKGALGRSHGTPVARLADWLRAIPGIDDVAVKAFSVLPDPGR